MSLDERYHTGAGMAPQRATIVAECAHRGWELVEIVEDVGFSGRDLNRPGMRDLTGRLDAGEADCLVAAKLDRLSRSLREARGVDVQQIARTRPFVAPYLAAWLAGPAGEAVTMQHLPVSRTGFAETVDLPLVFWGRGSGVRLSHPV
jgi:hypothetical protein